MQGDSVFEVIAERILEVGTLSSSLRLYPCVSHGLGKDPNDADPKYVNFFHEKISSPFVFLSASSTWVPFTWRGQATTTFIHDELIKAYPQ